jgi:hypothetical protein
VSDVNAFRRYAVPRNRAQIGGARSQWRAAGASVDFGTMSDLAFDAHERRKLCEVFDALGPSVATLIDGWTAHDLAAHLVLRERDLVAGPAWCSRVRSRASPSGGEYDWQNAATSRGSWPGSGRARRPGSSESTGSVRFRT